MSGLVARPLTPDRWDDLVAVFGGGDGKGDCGRCWCMWWRLPRQGPGLGDRATLKAAFHARVAAGPPPGLVGYDGDGTPVGWVQVGPRADVPEWNGAGRITAPLDAAEADDPGLWGVSCFVVRTGHRRSGHAGALLDAAIAHAAASGAHTLDACPVEPGGKAAAAALYHGTATTFRARGFAEIARRRPNRPLMRRTLRSA